MADGDEVLVESSNGITTLTLNRPRAANSISIALAERLASALASVAADPGARLVVLRGAGRAFCAGGDLRWMADAAAIGDAVHELAESWHTTVRQLAALRVPVLTIVHGVAAGAGLGIVAASDVVVASDAATFTYAYSKVGLSPDGSTSYYLPRILGLRRATELALTGRVLSAAEALKWGLVTTVVRAEELEDAVRALVEVLGTGPTRAFEATKRLFAESETRTLHEQLDAESLAMLSTAMTTDAVTAIRAFLAGEAPVFHGR